MENVITKSQNYLLTVPNGEHNDIGVELKVGFHCMTGEAYIKEIEDEFQKFRMAVSTILQKISIEKEFKENVVLYTENDHEAGMLRIAIPFNILPSITKKQREKLIMAHLADFIRTEL